MADNTRLQNQEFLHRFYYFLLALLGLNLLFVVLRLVSSGYVFFDDIEHLRAAYFVSNGEVPYRDFFEHHHPLFWYVLAPLVAILPHNTVLAVYSGRIVCLCISLVTFFYIYKIEKRFIGGKICALICLNLYFWSNGDTPTSSLFFIKPDIIQRCFWFIGLYYLFGYFHYKKIRDLHICAISFTLSFLFLQTAAFLFFPLVVPIGYFLYKNPQRFSDFIKASVFPLLLLGAVVLWLLKLGIFNQYLELNWSLNSFLAQLWLGLPFPYKAVSVLPLLALLSFFVYLRRRKTNPYYLILCFLFACELLLRLHLTYVDHYCQILIIYASLIAAPLFRKNRLCLILFFCAATLNTFAEFIHMPINTFASYKILDEEPYGININSGVFTKRVSYYWSHTLAETVHDIHFHTVNDYDVNKLAEKYPPKYIYFFPQWSDGEYKLLQQKLSPQQLNIFAKHYIHGDILNNYTHVKTFIYQKKEDVDD
ncbi:MAG: glycosyltransferase family 39 protein [Alphaproteobacteria bacterium]|nr:glycosyltransferase family 39 protein [Alphaproteobacteria bacterium]